MEVVAVLYSVLVVYRWYLLYMYIYIYIYWRFYLAFKGLPHLLWIRKSRRQCSSDLLNVNLHGGHVINGLNGALLSWCWASYPTNILCSTHFRSSPFMSAHETGQWQALYTAYILAHTGWSAWILFIGDGLCWKHVDSFNMQYQYRSCWYNLAQWKLLMLRWTLFFWFYVC